MPRSRLFLFARFLDILWWVFTFALVYGAYTDEGARLALIAVFSRWIIRGLTKTAIYIEQEHAGRSQEYGPR